MKNIQFENGLEIKDSQRLVKMNPKADLMTSANAFCLQNCILTSETHISSLLVLPKLSKNARWHYTVSFLVQHFVFSVLQIYLKCRTNNPTQEEDVIWIILAIAFS